MARASLTEELISERTAYVCHAWANGMPVVHPGMVMSGMIGAQHVTAGDSLARKLGRKGDSPARLLGRLHHDGCPPGRSPAAGCRPVGTTGVRLWVRSLAVSDSLAQHQGRRRPVGPG